MLGPANLYWRTVVLDASRRPPCHGDLEGGTGTGPVVDVRTTWPEIGAAVEEPAVPAAAVGRH